MTGYEIMTVFRDSISHFWTAQKSQIYTICGIKNSSGMMRLSLEALKLCKNNAGFGHKRDMPNMPNRMPISHQEL